MTRRDKIAEIAPRKSPIESNLECHQTEPASPVAYSRLQPTPLFDTPFNGWNSDSSQPSQPAFSRLSIL